MLINAADYYSISKVLFRQFSIEMKTLQNYVAFGVPDFGEEEIGAITRILRSGWVGQGPETVEFESELAKFVRSSDVIAVNSCTSALFLSLKALGIGPGDEVVVPSLTWCSTVNAVLYLGATPVFCDVEEASMSASPATVGAALTEKTKAVVVVHYGGLAGDMMELRKSLPPQVAIVEDAAHALGAAYPDGAPVGSLGNLTCFSFYANKNLSTGDGGAVAVNDPLLARKVRLIAHQGLQSDAWKRFRHPLAALTPAIDELGYKMNFTDLLASVARVQLRRQADFQKRRLHLATYYKNRIEESGTGVRMQINLTEPHHARHLFVVRLPLADMEVSRDEFLLELRANKIGASIHYSPLHTLPLYKKYVRGSLPVAEALMYEILTLPFGVRISDEEAEALIEQFLDCLRSNKYQ